MSSRSVHTLHGREQHLVVARRELVAISRELHAREWVANHDGNVSLRLGGGRFLITPTALSKRVIDEADLLIVDHTGRVLQGGRRPFSEFKLHVAVYEQRADVRAAVPAHPPSATGLAVAGVPVEPRMLAEAVVSLGDAVPLLPYRFPGSADQLADLRQAAQTYDAVTQGNHGVLAWGDDLEQAFLRAELVEHLRRVQLQALAAGGVRTVPDADVERLLDGRAKAGLGPEGRRRLGK